MLRRKSLSLATALGFVISSVAVAQEATTPPPAAPPAAAPQSAVVGEAPAAKPATKDEERTEEIVVTGTRIKRKDLTTPAPVTVINRDQIAASGKVSIGDFLQALPEQGNAINTQFNNSGDGSTRVNLRSLGTARTLVLLNGRRMVAGGTGADAAVDLNSIPTAAIERVEILKDGASAVYGSDAIAGVVNLITRKTFTGTSASIYAGTSQKGDGTVYDLNVSAGTASDRGSLLFSAGYFNQQEIWAGDRGYSKNAIGYDFTTGETFAQGSSAVPNGRFTLDPTTCTNATCTDLFGHFGRTTTTNWIVDPVGGYTPTGGSYAYRPYSSATDTYNFQPENYLSTPQERIQLYSIGDTKFGDVARGYFEASYVNRQSAQKLAPEPLFTITTDPLISVSSNSYYNPFGVDIADVRRRLVEFGNRDFTQDVDTYRTVLGLDGTLPDSTGPLAGWFWDASYNFGRTFANATTSGTLRAPYVGNAIGPSFLDPTDSVVKCGNPGPDGVAGTADDVVTPNCVPLNVLGGAGTITQAQVAGLGFTGNDVGSNQMSAVQLNTSGELFNLMADRPVGLALGYEWRDMSGKSIPNPISAAGENTGNNFAATGGSYTVNEVYGELSIPIVSNLPFAQDLEATLAARWFDYSTFGSDYTYKLGARWRIIPDVTIRGTYSTAFRAPSIPELYLGNTDSFPTATDPCAGSTDPADPAFIPVGSDLWNLCTQNGAFPQYANNGDDRSQLKETLGGNAALDPETADIYTVGVVWEPSFVKGLSVTVDYYSINVDNAITTIGTGTILAGCYTGGQYCNQITRDEGTGKIMVIDDRNTNVGGDKTSGIDVSLRYGLPSPYGRFGFAFDGTWLQKYDRTLADGTVIKAKGTYDIFAAPEYKFNAGVTWGWKGFGAGLSTRFIGSYKECANADGINGSDGLCYVDQTDNLGVHSLSRDVAAWASTDLFVTYSIQSGLGRTNISAGMNNVFDDNPAVVYDGFLAASDAATYDYIGRYMYVRLEQTY